MICKLAMEHFVILLQIACAVKIFLNALRSCSFILAIDAVHYDQPLILCELKVLDETAKHTLAKPRVLLTVKS